MKREKRIALKILKYRNRDFLSNLKVKKYKIYDMKKGDFGHAYQVYYRKGYNWLNPLTYIVLIVFFLIVLLGTLVDLLREMREECLSKLYADEIDIKDYEQIKMNLSDKEQ
ncbi:MAG: hypothetical protein ACRC6T_11585 [Sarcina sp.]